MSLSVLGAGVVLTLMGIGGIRLSASVAKFLDQRHAINHRKVSVRERFNPEYQSPDVEVQVVRAFFVIVGFVGLCCTAAGFTESAPTVGAAVLVIVGLVGIDSSKGIASYFEPRTRQDWVNPEPKADPPEWKVNGIEVVCLLFGSYGLALAGMIFF